MYQGFKVLKQTQNFNCGQTAIAMIAGVSADVATRRLQNLMGWKKADRATGTRLRGHLLPLAYSLGLTPGVKRYSRFNDIRHSAVVGVDSRKPGGVFHWVCLLETDHGMVFVDPYAGRIRSLDSALYRPRPGSLILTFSTLRFTLGIKKAPSEDEAMCA